MSSKVRHSPAPHGGTMCNTRADEPICATTDDYITCIACMRSLKDKYPQWANQLIARGYRFADAKRKPSRRKADPRQLDFGDVE